VKQFIPERKKNTGSPTAKDITNVMLIGFISTIVTWTLCDLLGLSWIPKEVAAAVGGTFGYFIARRYRY
jgi:hypothetical protein